MTFRSLFQHEMTNENQTHQNDEHLKKNTQSDQSCLLGNIYLMCTLIIWWPKFNMLTWRGQDLWPMQQPNTRGRLRCFDLNSKELSRSPSFTVNDVSQLTNFQLLSLGQMSWNQSRLLCYIQFLCSNRAIELLHCRWQQIQLSPVWLFCASPAAFPSAQTVHH